MLNLNDYNWVIWVNDLIQNINFWNVIINSFFDTILFYENINSCIH